MRGKGGDESTAESGRQDVNHPPFFGWYTIHIVYQSRFDHSKTQPSSRMIGTVRLFLHQVPRVWQPTALMDYLLNGQNDLLGR